MFKLVRHSSRYVDLGHLLSVGDVEHAETLSGRSGNQVFGVFGDIDGPAGVADFEQAGSNALECVIHAHLAVITACEQQVAIVVVHNLAHGARMARQVDGLHRGYHFVMFFLTI